MIKEGTRYAIVTMGAEMKDPQTGQSLGRVESPCCDLVVDRVTPNLSYGRLENVRVALEDLPAGALQVRDELKGNAVAQTAPVVQIPATAPEAPARTSATVRSPQTQEPAAPKAPTSNDEKW